MPPKSEGSLLTGPPGFDVLYLIDAGTGLEEKMLLDWLAREVGPRAESVRIRSSRRKRAGDDAELAEALKNHEEAHVIPLRVVWMPPKNRTGRRQVSVADIFKPGDPRDPYAIRARFIRYLRPKRVRLVASRGELVSVMEADRASSGRIESLESYITRRSWRALDNAERRLQGNRYKIPRFVSESMLARREFQEAIEQVAKAEGMTSAFAHQKAERYLREIAATHSPYLIDIIAGLIQKLYSQGYGEIKYSTSDVQRIAALGQDHPVVFLPAHRSNLDRLSLQFMLWENDLPPNHTAGGINLNFFPVGPLIRRTGVFFIRRSFRHNELYKTVLRAYLDYLMENRFPLEFYLEGGRSRSGKLLPPRMGLLSWVADSYRRGKADDIQLVPVSIAYDLIQDVPDYAREAQGRDKERESLRWLFKAVRSLRRRYGDIYIAFGEPVSLSEHMQSPDQHSDHEAELQKVAFEVMHRIGRATPITPTALMSVALLAEGGTARTAAELGGSCAELIRFASLRDLDVTERLTVGDPSAVVAVLEGLVENGYVSRHEAVGRVVYWLNDDQMIRISYYRNMIVHYFVPRALAEMALQSLGNSRDVDAFNRALLDLRDLLKFEFFFADKDEFLAQVDRDMSLDTPEWKQLLSSAGADEVATDLGSSVAQWSVLPFLDGYQVVGDELESLEKSYAEGAFLKSCLARARLYRIEGKLISGESASQILFRSALSLAANRDLLGDSADIEIKRKEFAAEVRGARSLAASRGPAHSS